MQEIEVGEYIRLNYGKIDKVKNTDYYMQQYIECENGLHPRENIEKHSKNIIDIIEAGDYVNKKLISKTDKIDNRNYIEWEEGDMYSTKIKNDKFIKSIVTHEQFESIEYKI